MVETNDILFLLFLSFLFSFFFPLPYFISFNQVLLQVYLVAKHHIVAIPQNTTHEIKELLKTCFNLTALVVRGMVTGPLHYYYNNTVVIL